MSDADFGTDEEATRLELFVADVDENADALAVWVYGSSRVDFADCSSPDFDRNPIDRLHHRGDEFRRLRNVVVPALDRNE